MIQSLKSYFLFNRLVSFEDNNRISASINHHGVVLYKNLKGSCYFDMGFLRAIDVTCYEQTFLKLYSLCRFRCNSEVLK